MIETGGVKIRSMQVEDIDAILVIDHEITGLKRAVTYDLDRDIGGQFDLSFVAEIDKEVVGFVLASSTYIPERAVEACALLTIGIHPDYQQRGIATKLIEKLMEVSRSKRMKTIRVMVDQRDTQLRDFLDHLEFNRGRLIEYYKEI